MTNCAFFRQSSIHVLTPQHARSSTWSSSAQWASPCPNSEYKYKCLDDVARSQRRKCQWAPHQRLTCRHPSKRGSVQQIATTFGFLEHCRVPELSCPGLGDPTFLKDVDQDIRVTCVVWDYGLGFWGRWMGIIVHNRFTLTISVMSFSLR